MEIKYYDDFDDFDEENHYSDEDIISKICFPIVNLKESKNIGTGIIIDSNGYFISVAHNFEYPLHDLKANIGNEWCDMIILHKEYVKEKFMDLVIGRISNIPTSWTIEKYPKLQIPKDTLNIGDEITLVGFKTNPLIEAEKIKDMYVDKGVHTYKLRIKRKIIDPKEDLVFKNLPTLIYNENIIFFENHSEGNKLGGFSGGPTYIDGKLLGITLSHYFLKIEYIIGILKKMISKGKVKLDKNLFMNDF